jgi:cytidylate kinase
MSLSEFSALAERDPAIDLALDERLAARAIEGGVVLESRLAGWIATDRGLPAVRVWIDCEDRERARRVAAREGTQLEQAVEANRAREDSEAARYRSYYGIDLADRSVYDLVLDSTVVAADDLVAVVVAVARAGDSPGGGGQRLA